MESITSTSQINVLVEELQDAYQGEPWFGRSVKALLAEVDEVNAFEKPQGQHSILQLVWHMANWREFVISRLDEDGRDVSYFDNNDWLELDHSDKSLWTQGLQKLDNAQSELIQLLQDQKENILDKQVGDRNYTYRKMIAGIIQHDIYHLGQIAYITKLLSGEIDK